MMIPLGRVREVSGDGDSVAKLHTDLSDAVNIMCHQQVRPFELPPRVRCGEEASNTSVDPRSAMS